MQPRHVPLRRCIGCGTRLPKRELNRIVRVPGGSVEVDPTGKMAGRGAYLCSRPECWEQSIKKNRLDYALRERIAPHEQQHLLEYAQNQLKMTRV